MNRKWTLFVLLWSIPLLLTAQSDGYEEKDSVTRVLKQLKPGSEAFHQTIFKLIDYSRAVYPDSTIYYAELSLRHNPKGIQPHQMHARYLKADAYSILGEFKRADSLFQAMQAEVDNCRDSLLVADYYNCRAINHGELAQYDASIRDYKKSYEYCRYLAPKEAAKCLGNAASAFNDMDMDDSCLIYNLKALALRQEIADTNGLESSYCNIGVIYFGRKDWRTTIDYTHMADQLRGLPHYKITAAAYSMVNSYRALDMRDSAFIWADKGIRAAKKINSPRLIARSHFIKGELFYHYKQYDSALHYMETSLPVLEQGSDSASNRRYYVQIGNLYLELKRYDKAEHFLGLASRQMKIAQDPEGWLAALRGWGEASLRRRGLNELAERYGELEWLTDSLHQNALQSVETELLVKYETEQKEWELQQARANNSRQRLLIIILSMLTVFSVLFIAGTAYFRKAKRHREEQERKLRESQIGMRVVLETEEKERQRIARELHDGLGQQLSVIKLKLETLKAETDHVGEWKGHLDELGQDLDRTSSEVREISHAMMPAILEFGSFGSALRSMLLKSLEHTRVQFDLEENYTEAPVLGSALKLSLYRIAQEAVNNALRHGNATRINIVLHKSEEKLMMEIRDNGKGFDPDEIQDGLGLRNMRQRVYLHHGSISIISHIGEGTTIQVSVDPAK